MSTKIAFIYCDIFLFFFVTTTKLRRVAVYARHRITSISLRLVTARTVPQ